MGSQLRPELGTGSYLAVVPRDEVLRRLYKSVARRRTLVRGKLDEGNQHCALGCMAADCQKNLAGFAIASEVADEIAAINDKLGPRASPKKRWGYVMRWKEMSKLDSEAKIKGEHDGN